MPTVRVGRGFSYRLKAGSYHLRVYNPEKSPPEKSVALGTDNAAEAGARALELYERYRAGTWDPWRHVARDLAVGEAIAAWQAAHTTSCRPWTLKDTAYCVRGVGVPDEASLQQLTPERIRKYINRPKLSQATRGSYYRKLASFFSWCVSRGMLSASPMDAVERPRAAAVLPRGVEPHQLDRLLRAKPGPPDATFPTWAADAWRLIAWTGMRPGEAVALRWADISWDDGYIWIRSRGDRRTKTDRERAITMVPQAADALGELVARDPVYCITGPYGQAPIRPELLSRAFTKTKKALKLPAHLVLYSLRHTFAAEYRRRGGSLSMLQGEMGHSSIQVTQRYGHLGPADRAGYTRELFEDL